VGFYDGNPEYMAALSMNGDTKRFLFLDGLRGWAAVVVLFHHVFVDGLPANDVMADKILWAKIFFMNGTFAVCLFLLSPGFHCRSVFCRPVMKETWSGWQPVDICGWRCRSL
jgi:hypothetical protein